MKRRYQTLGITCMSLGTALLACVNPSLVDETDWLEAQTPYFTIWSSMEAGRTRELADDLLHFRTFFADAAKNVRTDPVIPTYIYAFASPRMAAAFLDSEEHASAFHSSMRDNRIVLYEMDSARETLELQRYQYARSLLRNDGSPYPLWYERGLAQLLGTAEILGDQAQIGRPSKSLRRQIRYATSWGRWVSVKRLLERSDYARNPPDIYLLHAEYWLLVHYLHLGRGERGPAERDVAEFLRLWSEGKPAIEALEQALGTTARELDDTLRAYAKRAEFHEVTIERSAVARPDPPDVRPFEASAMAEALGWLSLKDERFARATRFFEEASSLDTGNAHARAGVAVVLDHRGRFARAASLWSDAIPLAPDSALNQLEYARHWDDRASGAGDPSKREQLLAQAREHYLRSRSLDATRPETHALYGATYLNEGENTWQGFDSIVRAHEMLGSNPEFNLFLACAYARVDRPEEARSHAWIVREWLRYWRKRDLDRLLRQYPSGCQQYWQELLYEDR